MALNTRVSLCQQLCWAFTFISLHFLVGNQILVQAEGEECGVQVGGVDVTCPLNVCCSQWGFCGVLPGYCDPEQNCQSNCQSDFSPTNKYTYDVRETIIAYYETWAPYNEGCGRRLPSDIPMDSVTHINTAFGYIQPDSYVVHPIDGTTVSDFKAVTNMKGHAPGTKVWLALGGWTFSDNDTTTQPVFGDLSSTQDKRSKFIKELDTFMTEWGFDGVDFDWEYPAAPDRRGNPEDTKNFLYLLQDVKDHFDSKGLGWGLSFTAPSSLWYMKWFDIENMAQVADFVNLMTYDLHGSWDNQSSWIGPHIYAHTNMTEIKDALQLLWRNNVPAEKVNLGLAFYGRSYTLSDPECNTPGCDFSGPGRPGQCSGTPGYLSYVDIKNIIKSTGATPIHDEETGVKYLQYDKDQWVSYDDPETLKAKVTFANSIGLRGLFIWAIDQDTPDHELLKGVLDPYGLGHFANRSGDDSDFTSHSSSGCAWSDCGPSLCGPGQLELTDVKCADSSGQKRKRLCCPLDGTPDPDFCTWRSGSLLGPLTGLNIGCSTGSSCTSDELLMASDNYFLDPDGGDASCLGLGLASYCCKKVETGEKLCGWTENVCISIGDDGKPDTPITGCDEGDNFVTYRRGSCGTSGKKVQPYCCNPGVDLSRLSCHWNVGSAPECSTGTCGQGEVNLGQHEDGGGKSCWIPAPKQRQKDCPECVGRTEVYPTLCCNSDALKINVKTLPVPVENLFFEEDLKTIPEDSVPEFEVVTDGTMGGAQNWRGDSDPNQSSFAWHIIDGPRDEVASVNKRDGSHWEVYGCDPEMHEGKQTAKMVCTDDSETSNCHDIWLGQVEATVLRMPDGCGPGKYAMAISLEPLPEEKPPPHIILPNRRRGSLSGPIVYELTFDYKFSVLQKRASNALIRIDYSDNPGYWNEIVSGPGKNSKRDRERIKREVEEQHGGDWHAYLDHTWNLERRSTPDHELHLLHERWFSAALDDWIQKMKHVEQNYTAIRHTINKVIEIPVFDESKVCQIGGVTQTVSAKLTAAMNIKMETSGQVTLIGNLGDLRSFKQSHLTFRNKGFITALIDFQAKGELRFGSLNNEIAGLAPLGASVVIPGIVTMGPQFKLIGGLQGVLNAHANAQFQVTVADWDFAQSYPYKGDKPYDEDDLNIYDKGVGAVRQGISDKKLGTEFTWDVAATGTVEVHIIPQLTFGIVFNAEWDVPDAAIDLGVDCYGRLYANAEASSDSDVEYCYGVDVGYQVYARATAPTLFNFDLNQYWEIIRDQKPLLKSSDNCKPGGLSKRNFDSDFVETMPLGNLFPGSGQNTDVKAVF